ncbi:MAG: 30S ribosomal protein S12 methylthiotransferase RimO [Candidatus Omnitrophota bacterium]|nr:MAG: 30S ribosomal protein S12 methylthiotransferase RimO [Candidatus Omnitrophota bacterium]
MEDKLKIGILSLGCCRNLVDSENILGRLWHKGYQITDIENAEVGIINTCAFIDDAKNESIGHILDLVELKKEGRLKKIIVYGCLAQRYKEKLRKEFPEVDAFVGCVSLNHSRKSFYLTPRHYKYLKICEGCINNCSYCIIPKIKGGLKSLEIDSVINRIKYFDRNRVSEVNIIGQDITGYGIDLYGKNSLHFLLKKILKEVRHIGWLRLLYLYPSRVNEELLDSIKNHPGICKYIDLPLQHINARILKLMGRKNSPQDIYKLIDKIRKKIPQAAIRTSFIVGFPSETKGEFRQLVKFIREVKFERLGVFTYSRQEDTKAYSLKEQIPQKEKSERFNTIMSVQQEISRENNKKLLGKTLDVLIDCQEKGAYLARSEYDAPEVDGLVYVNSRKKLMPGEFKKVRIVDTLEYDLVAETLN